MKALRIFIVTLFISFSLTAQVQPAPEISPLLNKSTNQLSLGGYGDIEFIQPISSEVRNLGKMDIHRLVLLMAYQYNDKLRMITEIEFEHVKEVFIEQAFIDYRLNKWMTWRSGLILVPMGIVNERHESNTFNGTLRPTIDKYMVPTTWREIGTGFQGNYIPASFRYQLYVMNGFNGYDGTANFSGSNGLRSGRQKAAKSYISRPNISAKIEYYGLPNLNLGLALYHGDSQSTAYAGISKEDAAAKAAADSTVVGINMIGLDARYQISQIQLRGQLIYTDLADAELYNLSTGSDIGASMLGYYAELGYAFNINKNNTSDLTPFIRYEWFNTHQSVDGDLVQNQAYDRDIVTVGLTFKPVPNVAFKADIQSFSDASIDDRNQNLNMGLGFAF